MPSLTWLWALLLSSLVLSLLACLIAYAFGAAGVVLTAAGILVSVLVLGLFADLAGVILAAFLMTGMVSLSTEELSARL